MKANQKRFVIPLMFGVAFVVLILILMVCVNPASPIWIPIGWPAELIFRLAQKYKIPPAGGDEAFAWFILAPALGLFVWFMVGGFCGWLWLLLFRRNQYAAEDRTEAKKLSDVYNHLRYAAFLAEQPDRLYLYKEVLPQQFNQWLGADIIEDTPCDLGVSVDRGSRFEWRSPVAEPEPPAQTRHP